MGWSNYVEIVKKHVENVVELCSFGESPLLADEVDLATGKPVTWEGKILSNLACQQNFLRTLDALGQLGDEKYHEQADEWIGCGLDKIQDEVSDLFYWGGHTSYDLLTDRPVVGNHEMKCVYPHYQYLYRVNPEVTGRFVKANWHAHIWDWRTLLFNRHGIYGVWEETWDAQFEGGPLPLVDNTALSFVNTGSDLILCGTVLHALSGDEIPLRWAMNLLSRYEDIRHPESGLAGYQFNHSEPCRVRNSFKSPYRERQNVNEVTVVTNNVIQVRYGRAGVTWLNAADVLGEDKGQQLRNMVTADLLALADQCYDANDHCFHAAINDGTRLCPENTNEGAGYCSPSKLRKVPANGLMMLAYARGFNVTGVERFREMAYLLAEGMGWGDLNSPGDFSSGGSPESTEHWVNRGQNDASALFGLLELYSATGEEVLLQSATLLGERLLDQYVVGDLIVSGGKTGESNIDSALPLALLHLEGAKRGNRDALPRFYPNNTYFDPKIVVRQWAEEEKLRNEG